ncbi:MAG: VOC family protein [Paracoccaceae bacterium]
MSDNHGAIWWSELMTRDVDAARKYYTEVCGWSTSAMPMPEGVYTVCSVGEKPVAGIMDMTAMEELADVPAHWFTYIAVDDVDKAVAQTRAAGGNILREVFEVENIGRIAIVQDPTGAAVGIMTAAPPVG